MKLSFARDQDRLRALAEELGGASVGTPADAAGFGEVVVLSVPWSALPEALDQAGSLEGKVVIEAARGRPVLALHRSGAG